MDRHWYHNFLRAAGIHAGRIEELGTENSQSCCCRKDTLNP